MYPNSFSKPVIPLESTIPSYIWYLPAIPNLDFLVPSQNLFKSFPFVTVQAHGAVREISIFHAKNILTEVLTSKIYIKKSYTSPILDDGMKWTKSANDRWNEKFLPYLRQNKKAP